MKVLITGATNGMGKGVAKALAEYAAEKNDIIILCRSEVLGLKTLDEIKLNSNSASLSLVICDLSDMSSVKRAVLEIKEKHDYLDSIFINAGIGYAPQRIETVDGMDSHFQVNYISQFYLLMQVLELLEKSTRGGRVIFNATPGGKIYWDDIQMVKAWGYEKAIQQAMVAKRMLLLQMHELYRNAPKKISFVGFSINKIVWSNQLNIIPMHMRISAAIMRAFGMFMSIEACGDIMAPLFMENMTETNKKSGSLWTWKKNKFEKIDEVEEVQNEDNRNKMMEYSLQQCKDDSTRVTSAD